MSNHQDFLVNMSMGVPLLPVSPEDKSAISNCLVRGWSSPPVSSRCSETLDVLHRCEQRRLFMFPACVHPPVQNESTDLKTASRCPHAPCEGAWWGRWGIRTRVPPWTKAVVNVDRSGEKNPSWLPDPSLPASDVVLNENNWTTIGLLIGLSQMLP